ncbi:hypothetical protein VTK73DRAFT_7937 [Phialemonium thermophilum]|uniref:Cyanovirin-N domain-containing protein n=1 Tax=Phialemonium thermophilum TaxID=223376 RepID=A0ABR3WBL9_9PEZI
MRLTFLSQATAVAILPTAAVALPSRRWMSAGPPHEPAPMANFSQSCTALSLNSRDKARLDATCNDLQGRPRPATIDLNICLVNSCGALVGRSGGHFGPSCDVDSCFLSKTSILCNCRDCSGNTVPSIVDLEPLTCSELTAVAVTLMLHALAVAQLLGDMVENHLARLRENEGDFTTGPE